MLPELYDQSLLTRNVCIAGSALTWLVALGAFIGSILSFTGHFPLRVDFTGLNDNYTWSKLFPEPGEILFPYSAPFATVAPLFITALVTGLNECMGYIHATSLRWNLLMEGRLQWNTNLRLLSTSHHSITNSWYMNTVFFVCITFSYAAASQLVLDPVFTMDWCLDDPGCSVEVLMFNGIAGIRAGNGLLWTGYIRNADICWTSRTDFDVELKPFKQCNRNCKR